MSRAKPYKKIAGNNGNSTNYGNSPFRQRIGGRPALSRKRADFSSRPAHRPTHAEAGGLCEYFIKTYTRPGEVVVDICAGSATTAVAALNTGRRFICFETVPAYYAAATERIRVARAALEGGEKGGNYRTVFCDLCRSPGATRKRACRVRRRSITPQWGLTRYARSRWLIWRPRTACFLWLRSPAPGGPAADQCVGLSI